SPPFHGDRLRAYGRLICEVTEELMSSWVPGRPFSVPRFMQQTTLQVISHAVFGRDGGPRLQQLRQHLGWLLDVGTTRSGTLALHWSPRWDWGPLSPWGWLARHKREIDQLILEEIRERRESSKSTGSDVLSLLIAARDESGQARSEVELRDEVMSLLFAGHET